MPKSLANIRAILFDLDQTLLDWRGYKKSAINASVSAMSKAGIKLPEKRIKKMIHEIYKEKGYEYQRVFDDLLKKLNINPEDRIYDKIKAAGIASYREAKRKYLKPYPDVPFVLEDLINMGYKLGLVSDAPSLQGWIRLYELDLVKYFQDDHVYIAEGIKSSKKAFKMIMKEHGYVPHELLMVGDNPQTDIKPANELGIITAIVEYGQVYPIDSTDPLQHPDYCLKSIWELIELLRKAK